jgi:DNA-binding CsgD family transcriptional regulator
VAAGHGNDSVAAALFVTRRTVETHLTSVYRKLGVKNRVMLAEALRRVGSTG